MPANARGDEERQMSGHEYPNEPRIVAGIDGSASSMSALRWAIWQTVLTDAPVDAVIAWHYPVAVGGYGWAPDRGSRGQPGGSVTPEQPHGARTRRPATRGRG